MVELASLGAVSSMVEHFVYTEGVGSSSLSPPKAYVERDSKDPALVFGVADFGDLLYIFYSGEIITYDFRCVTLLSAVSCYRHRMWCSF